MAHSLIGLGSNLGDRAATLRKALACLETHHDLTVVRVSSFFETEPVGGPAGQAPFLNAAAILAGSLSPPELLRVLQDVEQQLGRVRRGRWDARTIDLDLLLYDQTVWQSPELVVPHPRIAWREFVLQPAAEVAGDWRHPQIGWTLGELLRHLRAAPNLVAISCLRGDHATRLAQSLSTISGDHVILNPYPADLVPSDPRTAQPKSVASTRRDASRLQEQRQQLSARAATIRRDGPSPPAASTPYWWISDFWLPDSLRLLGTFPADRIPADGVDLLRRDLELLWPQVWHPKLLVVLQDPATQNTDAALWDQPLLPPFIQVPRLIGRTDQPSELLEEVRAALRAMTTHPGE